MNLTQAAMLTRRGIIAFLICLALVLTSLIGYRIWHQYYLSTQPPVEEKPDLKFGVLPDIIIPASRVSSSNYSYSLDTTTGGFPEMPKIMKVYFLPRSGVLSLLAPEKSAKLAESLSFSSTPQVLSPTVYRFTNQSKDELVVDLITGNFKMERKVSTSSAQTNFPTEQALIDKFKTYLSQKDLLPEELSSGRSKVIFNNTTKIASASATVSIWPQNVDEHLIVTADHQIGLIYGVYMNVPPGKDNFVKLNYTYWPVDTTTSATYPIITPKLAFENLKIGKGYVTMESNSSQISITSISLAFYQSEEYAPYMQPVYLFEGPAFAAIVPAIQR